jgi:hypothetical protein
MAEPTCDWCGRPIPKAWEQPPDDDPCPEAGWLFPATDPEADQESRIAVRCGICERCQYRSLKDRQDELMATDPEFRELVRQTFGPGGLIGPFDGTTGVLLPPDPEGN